MSHNESLNAVKRELLGAKRNEYSRVKETSTSI